MSKNELLCACGRHVSEGKVKEIKSAWEEKFEKWMATHYGTAGWEQKLKSFIRKVEKEAYEREKKEVVAILEMNLDLGEGNIYSDSEAQYKNRVMVELIRNLPYKQ